MVLEIVGEMLGWSGCVLILLILLLIFAPGRQPHNLPPGLPILPVVGSLFHLGGIPNRELLKSLKKKFGNVASFSIFSTRFVVVSGVSNIRRVFSEIEFAGKPDMLLSSTKNSLISDGRETNLGVLGGNGLRWQKQRRFVLRYLHDLGFGRKKSEYLVMDEVKELVNHIQQQKGKAFPVKQYYNQAVVNILWKLVSGQRYSYNDEKLAKLLSVFLVPAETNLIHPFFYIPGINQAITYIPVLKNILKPMRSLVTFVKEQVKNVLANVDLDSNHSMISSYIKEIKKQNSEPQYFNMDQMIAVVLESFAAGLEATTNNLSMGIYLLAKHPEIQLRVQQELDEVVGRDRLPSFSDMKKLHYTMATIHEVQRTLISTAFIIHSAQMDGTLDGYHIPKGAVILINMQDILTDPQLWKNSQEFDPENFLDENGQYVKNKAFMPFGIGKRVCAGEAVGQMMLFLGLSSLLQRFFFTVVDEKAFPANNYTFSAAPKYTSVAHLRPPL